MAKMQHSSLLSEPEAAATLEQAKHLVMSGNTAEGCFLLYRAWLSYRAVQNHTEALHTSLVLGWAQDRDYRSWQARRTITAAITNPLFKSQPKCIQSRALVSMSRVCWSLGSFSAAAEHADRAYQLARAAQDRGRAALAAAQAALYLGRRKRAAYLFRQAVRLDPLLAATAHGTRAYLHNLGGQHRRALSEAEAGLALLVTSGPENRDDGSRAVEEAALAVERGTAKAFLRQPDARSTLIAARELLKALPGNTELEAARIKRALALVLIRAREHNAAESLLGEADSVFRQRHAPEHDLTAEVYRLIRDARR